LTGLRDYAYREFWRLENAYDDFKNKEKPGSVLPYDNYPMPVKTGQVFVIDYTKTNGSVEREYYRSDGYVWEGKPSTEKFVLDEPGGVDEPGQVDTLRVGGKDYTAAYFGKRSWNSAPYTYQEVWRLENAYDDFKNHPKTNVILPYDNYPMPVEAGQVFVIDWTKADGSVERVYHRSDAGVVWNGRPSTVRFEPILPTSPTPPNLTPAPNYTGQIYLYGEAHGIKKIMEKEFELWREHYNNENMRHLFTEMGYFDAGFLNVWMQSDSNDILDMVFQGYINQYTAEVVLDFKDFYKKIKTYCPETVFHGTDVGHNSWVGEQFLKYLEDNHMESSIEYLLTRYAIDQGKYYHGPSGNENVYRENAMAENFIREFDMLGDKSVMGIYGAAHTGFGDMDYDTQSVPNMASQLKERYGNNIYSEDLRLSAYQPERTDIISVNGKDYTAAYFGKRSWNAGDTTYQEVWRLENAYDDFKNYPKTNEILPYDNYPMTVETGQVFVIDWTKADGSVERAYYRSDAGVVWNGRPSTVRFLPE
jgi:hypothetical protein